MPRDKDLKRLVRARMQKTGESYTAARARIVSKSPSKNGAHSAPESVVEPASEDVRAAAQPIVAPAAPPLPADPAPDYAKIAGMSDDALRAKTGCDWAHWVYSLDMHKAYEMPHREIATLVSEKFCVPSWWTQTVTVGYERIKGLRERGQRRGGAYEASKSRTFNVSVDELFDAWAKKRTRNRWLTDVELEVRTSTKPKSMRLALADGSVVTLWFTAKGDAKSSVSVQHLNLADRAAADRSKQQWGERLKALAEVLR